MTDDLLDQLDAPEPPMADTRGPVDELDAPAVAAAPAPSLAEQVTLGVGRGLADYGDTALNAERALESKLGVPGWFPSLANATDAWRRAGRSAFESDYGTSVPVQVARVGGQMLPLLGGGEAAPGELEPIAHALGQINKLMGQGGRLARTARSVGTGAAQGGGLAAATSGGYDDRSAAEQTKLGTVIGGLLNPFLAPLGRAVAAAGQKLFGVGPAVSDMVARDQVTTGPLESTLRDYGVNMEDLSPAVRSSVMKEAAQQHLTTGATDPEALARKANLEHNGMTPTTGMVTRDPNQFTQEVEMAKPGVGGEHGRPLQRLVEANNDAATQRLDEIATGTGGSPSSKLKAGQNIADAVKAKWESSQDAVSALYKQVRDHVNSLGMEHPLTFGFSPSGLRDAMSFEAHNVAMKPIADSIENRVAYYRGLNAKAGLPNELTMDQAEELRKYIRTLGDDSDPNVQRLRGKFQDALDGDVVRNAGEDLFGPARAAAKQRFSEFESSQILSDIVNDKRAGEPDFLAKKILGGSYTYRDLQNLARSLTTGTPEQVAKGKPAWDSLRRYIADDIKDGATTRDGTISFSGLDAKLDALGPEKLNLLFGPDGARKYRSLLGAVHDATVPPRGSAINYSNTASQWFPHFQRALGTLDTLGQFGMAAHPAGALFMSAAARAAEKGGEHMQRRAMKRVVQNALRGSAAPAADQGVPALFSRTTALGQAAANPLMQPTGTQSP